MGNKFAEELLERVDERFSVDSLSMSMTDWVCKNTTIKKRPFTLKGYEFQRAILDDMHPNLCCTKISQVGLALDLETPILTASGWKTMGSLEEGDKVYSETGKLCSVTYVSPVYIDRECYEVEFDDGSKIITDKDHKWVVKSERLFHPEHGFWVGRGRVPEKVRQTYNREGVLTTGKMFEKYKSSTHNLFYIENTKDLEAVVHTVPVDPYYLGFWLGNGHSYSSNVTCFSEDIENLRSKLNSVGYKFEERTGVGRCYEVYVYKEGEKTLHRELSELNVLKNKHIPRQYLQATRGVKLELLRGLMDSDGSITGGRCSFHNTNKQLISDVEELLASLGFKYHTRWREPTPGKIKSKLPIGEIGFVVYSDTKISNLDRKLKHLGERSNGRITEISRRRIVSINPVETRPVRCIQVDAPSHLYLAGRSLIPTHNTEIQIRKALGFLIRNQGTSCIFSLPNDDMYKRVSNSRVKPVVDADRVFNTPYDKAARSVRSVDMKQFGQSFLYLVAAVESAATSISADIVLIDEVDLSDQQMVALFNSRLQGSKYKISQRFSTPTFPAYGIDLDWSASDQHLYMVKCDCCGNWTYPEFTREFIHIPGLPDIGHLHDITSEFRDEMDFSNSYVKCNRCHSPLNLDDPSLREWVPTHPNRVNNRGYGINPFVTSNLDLFYIFDSMWKYVKNENKRGFFNTVLGKPYSDGSIQIPEDDIKSCMTNDISPPNLDSYESLLIGIDVGQTCNIVIGDGQGNPISFYTLHVDKLGDHVESLCKKYKIRAGCIDRHPYEPTADEVFRRSSGKIVPVEYRGEKDVNIIKNPYGDITHAQVNRTWMLDEVATTIKQRKMRISGYSYLKEVIIAHLRNMVREETPEQPAVWKKLLPDDHFFHAIGFMRVSPEVASLVKMQDKSDVRTLVLGHIVKRNDGTENLIGVSTKGIDNSPLKR